LKKGDLGGFKNRQSEGIFGKRYISARKGHGCYASESKSPYAASGEGAGLSGQELMRRTGNWTENPNSSGVEELTSSKKMMIISR